MRRYVLAMLTMFLVAALSACRPAPTGQFAIYLTADEMSGAQVAEADIATVPLQQSPIIAMTDIKSYTWDTQTLTLSDAASERLANLQVSVFGRAFVACVGSERIYAGAFWTPLSSASYDGVIIELLPFEGKDVSIKLGYPTSSFFAGSDPRADKRIMRALEHAGVLREPLRGRPLPAITPSVDLSPASCNTGGSQPWS